MFFVLGMPGKLYGHTTCQGNLISSASLVFVFFVLCAMDLVHFCSPKEKRKKQSQKNFSSFCRYYLNFPRIQKLEYLTPYLGFAWSSLATSHEKASNPMNV